jgi:hypothetical protein
MADEIDGVWANDSLHRYRAARDGPDLPYSWDVVFK